MAKGQKKKNESKKVPQEKAKEYPLITLEELRARELRHYERLADLKIVLHFLSDAFIEVEKYEDEMRLQEKWDKYVRCDGLPKPYNPPDVRLFFVKLRHFEDNSVTKTIDWQLSIDECSILNQDIARRDRTRKALIKEIRPNIGLEYDKNIQLALQVLKDIEYFLDDSNIVELVPQRILDDIVEQKTMVQQEIENFFNRFTYRILCSENAYMEQIDAISAEYCYEANNFEIQIWTLKKVPILFDFDESPSLIANFRTLKIELQIPFSLLQENLTIRGIHMNFDHYSEHAKSFEQTVDIPVDQLTAGITDLFECLTFEWSMQIQIMQEVRQNMVKTRLEFEEHRRQMEEEAARKEKERKAADRGKVSEKKKDKPKKPKAEPPIIADNVFPDVWNDFLEREKNHNEDFVNAVFHPNGLKLNDQEINLKKYMILGGTYQFYVVDKPNHTDFNFNSFDMTWHANNGNLHIDKDIIANLRAKRSPKRLTLMQSKRKTRPDLSETRLSQKRTPEDIMEQLSRMTAISIAPSIRSKSRFGDINLQEGDEKYSKDPELSPLFIITFELPSYLCLWGEPIPCHFEADIIGLVETFETKLPSFFVETRSTTTMSSIVSEIDSSAASNVNQTPRPPEDISEPLEISQSRQSIPSNVFRAVSTFAINKGQPEIRHLPIVEDFNLNIPMTKQQIRKLQRYCVPRILSSYKFPVEIVEEETEEARFKPKGEAGTLIRKRISDTEDGSSKNMERAFTFRNQNNPERVYPVFSKKEFLFAPPKQEDTQILLEHLEPETFFQLIESLELLKKKYRRNYRGVADVPQIVQRMKLVTQSVAKMKRNTVSTPRRLTLTGISPSTKVEVKTDEKDKNAEEKEKKKEHKSIRQSSAASKQRAASVLKKAHHAKKSKDRQKKREIEDTRPKETKLEKYSHWTRAYIYHSIFDRESRKFTIWTDRLGSIGFAYNRYVHFPFKYWSVGPSEENPETEIAVNIDTQHARCVIYVTAEGYHGTASEITLKYKKNKEIYLEINEPLNDLKELKKRFRDRNINIFSGHDARFYIEKGYFSEKHVAAELHIYSCMAIHGTSIRFVFSSWNRLASRRDIVLRFGYYKEPEEQLVLIRITPEGATFVDIKELCSDDFDEFKLEYSLTWRNIDYYADLHHCIMSIYPAAAENRVKNANLITNLKNLLYEIRPLSYS